MQQYHIVDNHITVNDDDYHQPLIELDNPCTVWDCTEIHVFVVTRAELDEYVAIAR